MQMKDAEQKNVDTEQKAESKADDKHSRAAASDIEVLREMEKKYDVTVMEKKLIDKMISLLETLQAKCMLPPQNIGDSVFKMYSTDSEPTEFLVDRVEFDVSGWNLISYEKFGTSEMEFIFSENDYNKLFFDTADEARNYHKSE